ncbi:hypothetical protein GS498_17575 [Rhodococcus hoagii]|nr:hypothetical protein [Prescottella equi]
MSIAVRFGSAARALGHPTSSVVLADQLHPIIDGVPVGTNNCARAWHVHHLRALRAARAARRSSGRTADAELVPQMLE